VLATLEAARSSKRIKTRCRLTTGEILANSKEDKRVPSFSGRKRVFSASTSGSQALTTKVNSGSRDAVKAFR
jgi:hypothetical protein